MFFELASALQLRFSSYRQPEDIKTLVVYLRFLRSNSRPPEGFHLPQLVPRAKVSSLLFYALAHNSELVSGGMIQEMEEMLDLIPDFLNTDGLLDHGTHIIKVFTTAFAETGIFRRPDAKRLTDRAIQMLREATVFQPDLSLSFVLARCLADRFVTTCMISDYDEAMTIADKVIDTHTPGDSLTMTQRDAIALTSFLLVSRLNSYLRPEYFEDASQRIRTFLSLPCLPDGFRTVLTTTLSALSQRRFSYFGITGNSGEITPNHPYALRPIITLSRNQDSRVNDVLEPRSPIQDLKDILNALLNNDITDVEAAVERGRKLLPMQSSDQSSSFVLADTFSHILFHAYMYTRRSDYLDEAITSYRGLLMMSVPKVLRFQARYALHRSLLARTGASIDLSHLSQDLNELMQLFPELANDGSGEVFTRFKVSWGWAFMARSLRHPSISIAYGTAMSLLEETLVFSPTLQTQHLRLADASMEVGGLPSDYASYHIENGRIRQAIETLERGRALLWSEMRGLRTSTDQLRAANPAIADRFADINKRLESVAVSVAQSDDTEIGDNETGSREHSIGHLVPTQRRLLEERNSLIFHIQSLPGFDNFMKSPSFDALNTVPAHGPVVIINQAQFSSHIIILLKGSPPSVIPTPSDFRDRANHLKNDLLNVRKEKRLDSKEYERTLAHVLKELYKLVGKPVIERFRLLEVPKKSRVWFCPTGAFCSLPLHAMGPIPSDNDNDLYFPDLYIPSYTPTLAALIESRKRDSLSETFDNLRPSILLVAQPDTLPGAEGEIKVIKAIKTPVTALISEIATPKTVIEGLRNHRFAHFVCHGLLETGKPFDASLELHNDNLTLLAIVRSQLPTAEFAFLAACHTAELTEGSVADEGLHLAAAMQYCGFRSVVGTMWAMADEDGADLSKHFYKAIFADKADQNDVPYHERSARALQIAVKKLRRKRWITLERWVNFVHYGA